MHILIIRLSDRGVDFTNGLVIFLCSICTYLIKCEYFNPLLDAEIYLNYRE